MIIELNGVTLYIQQGYTGGLSAVPHECTYCHRMTCFWENRHGRTACSECAGRKEQQ